MTAAGAGASVSVVIGAYNAAPWIRQTLNSVLAQTYPVHEVLVVDDGSTDETPDIVKSYGGKVHYFEESHRGRPRRNRGILAATGDYVAFIDADDYWERTKVRRQLSAMEARGARWAICDSQWLDVTTGTLSMPVSAPIREGDILEALLLSNFIVASTPIIARTVFADIGTFDETPSVAPVEDWDLWLRIAARHPVACVDEPLVTLRLHADSFLAATPLERRVRSLEYVVASAVAREPKRLGRLRSRALYNIYHAAAVNTFRQGQLNQSRHYHMKAWRQRPASLESIGYLAATVLGRKTSAALTKAAGRMRGRGH